MINFVSNIIPVNNIDLHYIDYENDQPKLLMMHGLTANAHAFNGLVKAGLTQNHHLYSVDLRGRGLSSKPAFAFSIKEHANDILALLDYLEVDKIHLCGHSFGGLLASYLAFHHPERVEKVIVLDAAPVMNPKAAEMLGPALSRLDHRFENFETYIDSVKKAPYISFWDDAMLEYYRADVATAEDGSVEPRSSIADITQIAINTSKEPWQKYFEEMMHETLLVNAIDNYTMNQPLLPEHKAEAIITKMKNASLVKMTGNHQTMLYGQHASSLVNSINDFLT